MDRIVHNGICVNAITRPIGKSTGEYDMTNLPGLTFVIAVTALVFALWPVVADAPREDGVTRYTPGRFLSSGDVYRQFERHRKDVEFDIWWVVYRDSRK